ncbi:MAG TPA: hypothetical protein VFK88_05130 [Gallionella sp.]|nr:hypothetical protein [Gallionella sp.]
MSEKSVLQSKTRSVLRGDSRHCDESNGMTQYLGYGLALGALFMSSACQFYYADEAILEHQKMIIDPYTPEVASKYGAGFVVTMRRDEAKKVKAPTSPEFKKMLEEQLAVERSLGHSYCPSGYEIKEIRYFAHSHTTINVDCK